MPPAPKTREYAHDVKFLESFGHTYERLRRENVARQLAKHMAALRRAAPPRHEITSPLPSPARRPRR